MDLRLGEREKALLWQDIVRAAEKDPPPQTEETIMKHRSLQTTLRIVLIAAVLTCIFTVTASATDLLGLRAVQLPAPSAAVEEEPAAPEADRTEESAEPTLVSVTQPQAVPEDLDPAVKEKVENARAAWAEWRQWKETDPALPRDPAVFDFQALGSGLVDYVENEDGSLTLSFYGKEQMALEDGELRFTGEPLETRSATAEERAAHDAYMVYMSAEYGDYDFNYDIHSAREAEKLEEIAAKYGLDLRHGSTLLWCKESVEEMDAEMNAAYGTDFHTDTSDSRFLPKAELIARIESVACHGDLFREEPRGFDKVYYFDEGSFCVSFYLDSAGKRLNCYGYNSVYSTLSSGREVVSRIQQPEALETRTHTAPDGTVLTILRGGDQVFLYAYLDNSFFEEEITGNTDMTDADINFIADFLIYQNIGK
jgi:hypothetical protein